MNRRRTGRRYYLSDIPLDEAVRRFHGAIEEAGGLGPSPADRFPYMRPQGG